MIIYLAETINILAHSAKGQNPQKDLKQTEKLIQSGQIKETEEENGAQAIKYLKINLAD